MTQTTTPNSADIDTIADDDTKARNRNVTVHSFTKNGHKDRSIDADSDDD
jgi:hypothetical protein